MNLRSDSDIITLISGGGPARIVSGTVSGAVRSGVTLRLSCAAAADRTDMTDDQGEFAFAVSPGVDCSLTPELSGYAFEPSRVTLSAGAGSQPDVSFTARPLLQVRRASLGGDAGCVEVQHRGEVVEERRGPGQRQTPSLTVNAYNDGVLIGEYDPDTIDALIGPGMNIRSGTSGVVVSR